MQKNQLAWNFDNESMSSENPAFLTEQLITYLGNKRSLLSWINAAVNKVQKELNKNKLNVFDVFSGSGVVSRNLKQYAKILYSNDIETYARVVNECYLTNDSDIDHSEMDIIFNELLQNIEEKMCPGFISEMYAPKNDDFPREGERVFYTQSNARYIDTARIQIEHLPQNLQPFFLGPLLSEASIHANTSGVFKGFYKDKTGIGCFGGNGKNALSRIKGEIKLRKPIFSRYECETVITQLDAIEAAEHVDSIDLAYLDPPYNQHPYGSNYFMLNLICDYRKPENVSEISGIPTGWNRSPYNKKKLAKQELFSLVDKLDSKYVLISYNSEGFIQYDEFIEYLESLGVLSVFETQYNTFRGSRNLRKRDLHTKEFLFLLKK